MGLSQEGGGPLLWLHPFPKDVPPYTPNLLGATRTLTIPQFALDALLAHRARQEQERAVAGKRWKETGFVFTTTIGTPLDSPTVSREF